MGVTVSSSHVVSAAPSSSGEGLLALCPCSSVRPQKLLQHESFPWAAALHELPHRGSFPRGAVLQEQAALVWVLHGVTSPASKPAPSWAPLSTGPQVLAGACSSVGSPQGHSFLQASTCSGMGYRWITAPPWISMDCRETTSRAMVFIMSCKGRLSAPTFWVPPPSPPSSLTLVPAEFFLTSSHSSLYTAVSLPSFFFFPFLNMLSQRHYHHPCLDKVLCGLL